jgi:hypothetical protein
MTLDEFGAGNAVVCDLKYDLVFLFSTKSCSAVVLDVERVFLPLVFATSPVQAS